MKKSMMTAACVIAGTLHAAEPRSVDNPNSFKRTFIATEVEVVKAKMKDIDLDQYGLVILSATQQRKLQKPDYGDTRLIGDVSPVKDNILFIKNSHNESLSDDDTYKSYTSELISWEREAQGAEKKKLTTKVVTVDDPHLMFECFFPGDPSTYAYFPTKISPEKSGMFMCLRWYGSDAIKQALIDLEKCYTTALKYGCDIVKDDNKTIAIMPLGTDGAGIPREEAAPVVVNAVLGFIIDSIVKNNPYHKIILFVKKRSEFAEYKKLIDEILNRQQLVACENHS